MSGELFAYWSLDPADLDQALAALRRWHAALAIEHPGLRACLFLRHDDAGARRTVMETYALPGGIPSSVHERIAHGGDQVVQPWMRGPRKIEVFVPLPSADPAAR